MLSLIKKALGLGKKENKEALEARKAQEAEEARKIHRKKMMELEIQIIRKLYKDPMAIREIPNPTWKMYYAAILKEPIVLRILDQEKIPNLHSHLLPYLLNMGENIYGMIKNPTEEETRLAVKLNGENYLDVENPDVDLMYEALKSIKNNKELTERKKKNRYKKIINHGGKELEEELKIKYPQWEI
jgi:hypothetical protein